jgi:glycosyltransferase involved in cell wall biosynthesis
MLLQTRLPDEVVVCDDGSKDATLDILEEFRKTSSFPVRIVRNEQNLKMPKNFEKCIGLCSGDLITLCDFDDAWYPNKLEVLCAAIEAYPDAGYIVADADLMDEDGRRIEGTLFRRGAYRLIQLPEFPFEIREDTLIKGNVVWGSSMMMRAEMRRLVLPLPGKWLQDYGIALLMCFAGSYGVAIPDCLMRYRLHRTQAFGVVPPLWQIWRSIPSIRSNSAKVWAMELELFSDLKAYVFSKPELLSKCKPSILQLLDSKIAHLERRKIARSSHLLRRWNLVCKELADGRYHQLSYSWYSFARDLLL